MGHSKHVWSRRGRTILLNSSFLLAKWILKHIYFICCLLMPAFPRVFSQIVNDFIVEEVKMVEPLHDQQGCWHLEGLCSVSVGWTLDLPRSIARARVYSFGSDLQPLSSAAVKVFTKAFWMESLDWRRLAIIENF